MRRSSTGWLGVVLALLVVGDLRAASIQSALKHVSHALGKSSDEASQGLAKVAGQLSRSSDEGLQSVGHGLVNPKTGRSLDKILETLKRTDATGKLARQLDELGPAERGVLAAIVLESRRVVEAGLRRRMSPDFIAEAIERGGPESLTTLRAMKSEEGIQACLEGLQRHGTRFHKFAKQGDEGAVRWLAKHGDRLNAKQLDELLANPAKFLDADGTLTKAGEDLLKRGRRSLPLTARTSFRLALVATTALGVWKTLGVIDRTIDSIFDGTIAEVLKVSSRVLLALFVLFLLWLLIPLLRSLVAVLVRRVIRKSSRRIPKPLFGLTARLNHWAEPTSPFRARSLKRRILRFGFLGSRRVGKSTFLVMLNKKLSLLVSGASFEPASREDADQLEQILREVSQCRRTQEEKKMRIRLNWPYRAGDEHSLGKMDQDLELADFPGEWATSNATQEERRKLIDHLREVDGLFVVIDPTDLESIAHGERVIDQKAVIDGMFREDGLDLGRRFHRALAVVITKRDLLDRSLLEHLARNADGPGPERLDRMCELAAKPSLTADESQELGRWVLDALFPGCRQKWETGLMSQEPNPIHGGGRWTRVRGWWRHTFRRSSRHQMSVFAVSLLGSELGHKVLEHREAMIEWERAGKQGPEPQVTLDLDRAKTEVLDFHQPFKWMFDHLPDGLIHQANQIRGLSGWLYRRAVYKHFPASPAVREDRGVGYRRIVGAAALVPLLTLVAMLVQKWNDSSEVKHLFADAARQSDSIPSLQARLIDCRHLPTRPYVPELNEFGILLGHQKELENNFAKLNAPGLPIEARLDLCIKWVSIYEMLPPIEEQGPEGLRNYHQVFDNWLDEVLVTTSELAGKQSDELTRQHQFDLSRKMLGSVRDALPAVDRASISTCRTKITAKVAAIAESESKWRFDQLKNEIEKLLADKPPKYPEAINKIDDVHPELQSKEQAHVVARRKEIMEQFWIDTKNEAGKALERDDPAPASDLLSQFEQSLRHEDDDLRKSVEKYRADLNNTKVQIKVRQAKELVGKTVAPDDNTNLEKGYVKLNEALHLLGGLQGEHREIVREWFALAVEIRARQKRWGEAMALLREGIIIAEPWARVRRQETWEKWTGGIAKLVDSADSQVEIQTAQSEIQQFLSKALEYTDCPKEHLIQVRAFRDRMGPVVFRKELEHAKETARSNPAQALEILLALRTDARSVHEVTTLESWRQEVVDLYVQMHRHPDAVKFLTDLEGDPQINTTLLPKPGLIEDLWTGYAKHRQEEFRSVLSDEPREAWRLLYRDSRESQASEAFRSTMGQFAEQQIGDRLGKLKEQITEEVKSGQFQAALDLVGEVCKELGEWANLENAQEALKLRKTEILREEVESRIAGIEQKLRESFLPTQFPMIEKDLVVLLARPSLEDGQRSRLTGLREGVWEKWERTTYQDIYVHWQAGNLVALKSPIDAYLNPASPFITKRTPSHEKAVKELAAWLEQFDRRKSYRVKAIRVANLPKSPFGSSEYYDFDPHVSVQFKDQNRTTTIEGGKDNINGSFSITSFSTNTQFEWAKGMTIEVGIWDDEVNKKGRCIGFVALNNPYCLLQLIWYGVGVNPKQFDYKDYPNFEQLRIGLEVEGLSPSPTLPRD